MSRSGLLLLSAWLAQYAITAVAIRVSQRQRTVIAPRGLLADGAQELFMRSHGHRSGDVRPSKQVKQRVGGSANSRSTICTLHPLACKAPFYCGTGPKEKTELRQMTKHIATKDGHANLHAWCSSAFKTDYIAYVDQCLKGDMQAAADTVYGMQKALVPGGSLLKADLDYCESAGLCNVPEVTENTTLMDAEEICDAKYTHEAWTSISTIDLTQAPKIMTRDTAPIWGMLACAMGNFHCDVMYCRLKHCRKRPEGSGDMEFAE